MYMRSEVYPPINGEPMPISHNELRHDRVELRGDGVTLKPLRLIDATAYYRLIEFDRDHLSQFGDETAQKYQTVEGVEQSIALPKDPFRLRFGIWNESTLVGSINVQPLYEAGCAEIGYWVGKEHTGHGYAEKALRVLSHFAFDQLGYDTLATQVARGNVPSEKIILRCGFIATGDISVRTVAKPFKDPVDVQFLTYKKTK